MDYYQEHERELDEFVDREVIYCVSTLVYDLGMGEANNPQQNIDILERFQNLYQGPPSWGDWECPECNHQWNEEPPDKGQLIECPECDEDLEEDNFYPTEYQEIYEHWIVSNHLADKLEEQGEAIERDFYGLVVWGRTTTGQAISLDGVISQIHKNMHTKTIQLRQPNK